MSNVPRLQSHREVDTVDKTVSQDKTAGFEAEVARLLAAAFTQENLDAWAPENEPKNRPFSRSGSYSPPAFNQTHSPFLGSGSQQPDKKKRLLQMEIQAGREEKAERVPWRALLEDERKVVSSERAHSFDFTTKPSVEVRRRGDSSYRLHQKDTKNDTDGQCSSNPRSILPRNLANRSHGSPGHLKTKFEKPSTRRKSKLPIRSPPREYLTDTYTSPLAPRVSSTRPLSRDQAQNTSNIPAFGSSTPHHRPSRPTDKTFVPSRELEIHHETSDHPVGTTDVWSQKDPAFGSDLSAQSCPSLDMQGIRPTSLSSSLMSTEILTEHGIRFLQDPIHDGNILILDELTPKRLGDLLLLSSSMFNAGSTDRLRADEVFGLSDHISTGVTNPSSQAYHEDKGIQAEQRGTGRNPSRTIATDRVESPVEAYKGVHDYARSDILQPALCNELPSYISPTSGGDEHRKTSLASEAGQIPQIPCSASPSSVSQGSVSPNKTVVAPHGRSTRSTQSQTLELIKSLLQQNARLKDEIRAAGSKAQEQGVDTKWMVAHRVFCPYAESHATYVDTPVWVQDQEDNHQHLDARRRIPNEHVWEEKQEGVPFIAYLEYHCADHTENVKTNGQNLRSRRRRESHQASKDSSEALHHRGEEVFIRSTELREALEQRISTEEGLSTYLDASFLQNGRMRAPYLMYYHFKELLRQLPKFDFTDSDSEYHSLMDYFEARTTRQSNLASEMIERGKITREYVPYLFKPGQILLRRGSHGLYAVKQKSRAVILGNEEEDDENTNFESISEWSLEIELIQFDGEFHSRTDQVTLNFPNDQVVVDIASLEVYPLRLDQRTRDKLIERGRLFWECRKSRYMAMASDTDKTNQDVRYMVDAKTYRLVHKSFEWSTKKESSLQYQGEQDDEEFFLRLPDSIQAFNMQEKKWHTVAVDSLKRVSWNTNAFKSLAVDQKTKTILEALVTNKIEADRGTDVVAGKGTGLIVLLHGGPGTGKTLTAESVAEFARKPLYRITCGDVGTHPKDVEQYLESAFQLGRTWDCVVLLDEADVFLEQRSFQNLERNALVSVFLRVLEYYDGILLLTSNRVGTFDEAFKSRIQLALHYDSLDQNQRKQIWANFINRLEYLNVEVDFVGIREKLTALASHDMNGRQIRNTITTARQLAKHEKKQVKYEHLVHVMEVSSKFDNYLLEVKDHVTDAEMQREEGIR